MPIADIYGVAQFRDVVNETTLTVACFTAVWCGPCKSIEKDLERLTYEFPNVRFARIDADNNTEIVTKCKVMQLPTFMLVRKGELLGFVIGAELNTLKAKIRSCLAETEGRK